MMKKLIILLIGLVLMESCFGAVAVQKMLLEDTTYSAEENKITVTHTLTNARDEPITDITFFETFPVGSRLLSCDGCELRTFNGNSLILDADDLGPKQTATITYVVSVPAGNHTMTLGRKTYSYMGAGQERLGTQYSFSIEKKIDPVPILIVACVAALVAFLILKKKKKN